MPRDEYGNRCRAGTSSAGRILRQPNAEPIKTGLHFRDSVRKRQERCLSGDGATHRDVVVGCLGFFSIEYKRLSRAGPSARTTHIASAATVRLRHLQCRQEVLGVPIEKLRSVFPTKTQASTHGRRFKCECRSPMLTDLFLVWRGLNITAKLSQAFVPNS